MHVFADYDGTITNLDTFDVLVRACAGPHAWEHLERELNQGRMTLREVLQAQAAFVHLSLDEADALLQRDTFVDPEFPAFVEACEARSIPVTVLSSGIKPLIERALARAGLARVPVVANAVDVSPNGWRIVFLDGSDNGHDKAATVRAAAQDGGRTVYCGDGPSDFAAAMVAQERFAKRGRGLERYLEDARVPFTAFARFGEVTAALFDAAETPR